jgi:hypothetical protein
MPMERDHLRSWPIVKGRSNDGRNAIGRSDQRHV